MTTSHSSENAAISLNLETAFASMLSTFKREEKCDEGGESSTFVYTMFDRSSGATDEEVLEILRIKGVYLEGTHCEHSYDCCGGFYFHRAGSVEREEVEGGTLVKVEQCGYINV